MVCLHEWYKCYRTVVKKALISYFEIEVRRTFIPQDSIAGEATYSTMAYMAATIASIIAQMAWIRASFNTICLAAATALLALGVVLHWPVAMTPGRRIKRGFNC